VIFVYCLLKLHKSARFVTQEIRGHYAALCNRADHYIFALWFLLSIFYLFSSPNLSCHRLDVYHTSTHGVALVQNLRCRSETLHTAR